MVLQFILMDLHTKELSRMRFMMAKVFINGCKVTYTRVASKME